MAFYDPGLGSAGDLATSRFRLEEIVRKFASSATGAGLGHNVVDCYEAIIKHYNPGDRIYLFGFSRGAYTARCVAGVLKLCGVPTKAADGKAVPRWGKGLRAIADEAVHSVYEHGSGRKRAAFQAERMELAKRFREKYGSDDEGSANVAPYFIGVFDTVAALGSTGLRRVFMIALLLAGLAVVPALAAGILSLVFEVSFWKWFGVLSLVAGVIAIFKIGKARLKVIRNFPKRGNISWHWTGWRFKFYDTNLDRKVGFARHALAIDERRADFARVPWGQPSEDEPPPRDGVPERFQQIWFAGNHSDIGGSYPEDESRLSDIALGWMIEQVEALPHPALIDRRMLQISPSADGMQHCEIESLLDSYPRWVPNAFHLSWKVGVRIEASGAPYHPSVLERFRLPAVAQCSSFRRYRPEALILDIKLAQYY